jgi:Abortive infection alpha
MDPVTAASEGASEGAVGAALEAFFGPAIELTELGRDAVRWIRFRGQVKIIEGATAMLERRGLAPRYVPAKTLVPLLELAGLEDPDDQDMQTRWIALLANAAAGDAANGEVLPSFPQILSELTAVEAQMLDWLAEEQERQRPSRVGTDLGSFGEQFGYARVGLGSPPQDPRFGVYVDNLERRRLCLVSHPDERVAELERPFQVGVSRGGSGWVPPRIRITDLGVAFVAACSALPERDSQTDDG